MCYVFVLTEQCGHTKPLIFSTMPRIGTPTFLQKVISRLTSPVDTACTQRDSITPRGDTSHTQGRHQSHPGLRAPRS